jgi:hypothetical protein
VTLKSTSGDIEPVIAPTSNMDITARAPRGAIKSLAPDLRTSDSQSLQTRMGTGGNQLDIQTETGQILFTYAMGPGIAGRTGTH